jgi:hypothetical protein
MQNNMLGNELPQAFRLTPMSHREHSPARLQTCPEPYAIHWKMDAQHMTYAHGYEPQPAMHDAALCPHVMVNVQYEHQPSWPMAPDAHQMTGMEQYFVGQIMEHEYAHGVQSFVQTPSCVNAALSEQRKYQQWPAAPHSFQMNQQGWSAGVGHQYPMKAERTRRAPVLARRAPVLAVRCVPTDATRSPVLAAETITLGNTDALPASSLTQVEQHRPMAESTAHPQRVSHQAPGWGGHATANSGALDTSRMSVDCVEVQAPGEGSMQGLWYATRDETTRLQMLADCAAKTC